MCILTCFVIAMFFTVMCDSHKMQCTSQVNTSIHAAHITDVHMVPMHVIMRPIPPVLDDAKVVSLMKTISAVSINSDDSSHSSEWLSRYCECYVKLM